MTVVRYKVGQDPAQRGTRTSEIFGPFRIPNQTFPSCSAQVHTDFPLAWSSDMKVRWFVIT
jgi:hypothetical protein